MAKIQFPATDVEWRDVESSNVQRVGWLPPRVAGGLNLMVVQYRSGTMYTYLDVSRQRVVAASRAASVGTYINEKIKPHFAAVKL